MTPWVIAVQPISLKIQTTNSDAYCDYFRRPKIHFISFDDASNTGDAFSSPLLYFPGFLDKGQCIRHDIRAFRHSLVCRGDTIIIGGGGLFNNLWQMNEAINKILLFAEANENLVVEWGIGDHSPPLRTNTEMEHIKYDSFHFLGVRDYNFPMPNGVSAEYVPCVTCVSEYFDTGERIVRKVGVIEHISLNIECPGLSRFQRIRNCGHISQQIKYIKSSEIIITNSYRAALWGTLIGKPVILTDGWASKFDYFERAPYRYSGNIQKDIEAVAGNEPYLEFARRKNIVFFDKVAELLNSRK